MRSLQFLADGPPRDGQIQANLMEGFAVETKQLGFNGRGVLTENVYIDL